MSKLIEQIMTEYDEMRPDGCWHGDHPILRMAEHIDSLAQQRNELSAQVERLRDEITAIIGDSSGVAGWHLNGEIARWGEFSDLEEMLSEPSPAALAALKAQWQADILVSTSIQIAAGKPEATPIQIATALLEESKRIRQRAQDAQK